MSNRAALQAFPVRSQVGLEGIRCYFEWLKTIVKQLNILIFGRKYSTLPGDL